MTQDQAVAAYPAIHAEISRYLGDVRPKLKVYEAHLVHEKVRKRIVASYGDAADEKALREIALAEFKNRKFKFAKGKGPK